MRLRVAGLALLGLLGLLGLLLAGCGTGDGAGPADAAPPPDAPAVDASPARTDLVPAVGTAGTLDVAAWNLARFPRSAQAPQLMADLVASLALDVVAVEEIDQPAALDEALAHLDGWDKVLTKPSGPYLNEQRRGILYRADEVTVTDARELFVDDDAFPRPPLEATIATGGTAFTLIVVHLKAGWSAADEQRRIDALDKLEDHMRAAVDGPAEDEILLVGDFNEDLGDPRADEAYAPFGADRYRFVSRALAESGAVTFLPSGAMLDHMIATVALDEELGAFLVPPLDEQLGGYEAQVSDHLPVVVRLTP